MTNILCRYILALSCNERLQNIQTLMIRTIIIEDEKMIAEEFGRMLKQSSAVMEIVATFSSVKDSVAYLSSHENPDLIFSDVQLPDGLSFDIFNQVSIK